MDGARAMSEVFIVFDGEDEGRSQILGAALGARGVRAWWDFSFAPERARPALMRAAIERSAATLVIWSPRAVVADWVVDAAGHAAAQGKLCAVAFQSVRPPPAFLGWSIVDLSAWQGAPDAPELEELVTQLEARIVGFLPPDEALRRARDRELGDDLADLRRALRKGGEKGWREYLRKQPDGAFALAASEQLRAPPDYVSPPELAQIGPEQEDHWRYSAAPLAGLLRQARPSAPLVAGFALLLAAGAGVWFSKPWRDTSVSEAPPQIAAALETQRPQAAPAPASAPDRNILDLETLARTPRPSVQPVSPPSARQHARQSAPGDAQEVSPALAQNVDAPTAAPATSAPSAAAQAEPAPAANPASAGLPAPTSAQAGEAFALANLDAAAREAALRARRAEARATDLAARARAGGLLEPARVQGGQYLGEDLDRGGVRRGVGVFASGARYLGEWRSGRPDGWGVLIYADGARYEGEFANGRPTGRGALWTASGARVVGQAQFATLLRRL